MNQNWEILPRVGLGPLRFGMTPAEVEAVAAPMGQIDDRVEESEPDGGIVEVEYRDTGEPLCVYKDGRLSEIIVGSHSRIDMRFGNVLVFKVPSKASYEALVEAEGKAYWLHSRLVFPALSLEVAGFVMDIGPKMSPVFREQSESHVPQEITLRPEGALSGRADEWLEIG